MQLEQRSQRSVEALSQQSNVGFLRALPTENVLGEAQNRVMVAAMKPEQSCHKPVHDCLDCGRYQDGSGS